MPDTSRAPSIEQVNEIVSMDDQPVLRNLLITQAYHDISQAMAGLLGRENANWCTFACWASRTAGPFIRKEEVSRAFRNLLESSERLEERIRRLERTLIAVHPAATVDHEAEGIFATAERVVDDVAMYIMQGNKVVFAELGLLFARFIQTFGGDSRPDSAKLQDFLAEYEIGDVQPDQVERTADGTLISSRRGGQSLLREVIIQYHQALFETDPKRKAELILLANAQGGLHEQTRLQTYIAGSLDAPLDDLLRLSAHAAVAERVEDHNIRGRVHAALDRLIHPIADELKVLWREFSTIAMMQMKLPDGVVHLGRDVPAPPGQPLFPLALAPIENPQLRETLEHYDAYEPHAHGRSLVQRTEEEFHRLVERFGHTSAIAFGSAATDWSNLSQRMRYIFELFRSRQQDRQLFGQPFTEPQRAALLTGQVPVGSLP